MEELKPCPICGSANLAMSRCVCTDMDHEFIPDTVHMHVFDLYCKECGCRVQAGGDTFDEAKNAVVEKWNNRAERTCRVDSSRENECDQPVSWFEFELSCGHTVYWDSQIPPSYCPECGRKVVCDVADYV